MATGKHSWFVHRGGLWVLAQGLVLALAAVVPVVTTPTAGPGFVEPAQQLGWLLLMLGVALAALGAIHLGRDLTPFPRPLETSKMHEGGIYAVVRHPIYCGLLFAALGWSLVWLSWAGVVCCLSLGVFFDQKASLEEGWLIKKFPDYAAYRRRVKKLIPWLY